MAAGLETAVDTRGHSKLVGNIVEKVLLARQLAENERKFAAKKAEEAGTSLEEAGIERGHFFKQALIGEFGGNYFDKKKKNLKNIVKKYKIAKRLTKDPKKAFKFVKPLLQKKVSGAQTKMFRAKFDYSYTDDINRPEPQTPIVGDSVKKIQKANSGKKRVSNEDLLKSLSSIAESLNKTAETIGRNTSGMSTGVISAVQSQHELVEQLKLRNTSIENKLDEIAKAISDQTQVQKKTIVKAKTSKTEQNLEAASDIAETEVADDTKTEVDETLMAELTQNITPTTNIINNQSLQPASARPSGGYPSMSTISKPGMDVPGFEKGGVVSGPNSGYLAKVPKGSTIVPLNNNYTNGKPSAIDGKVRQKPQSTSSSVGGRFGFGITNMTGISGGGTTEASKMAQPLIDAMSLPMLVAGGSILSTITKLNQSMGSEGEAIAPEIERMTRPIADVFGLPPSIVKRVRGGTKTTAGVEEKQEDKGESNKNILQKLMDGFGALLEKMGNSINDTNNTTTPGDTDYSNLKSGDISTNAGKVANLYDEFRNLGWTEEASKRMIAEIGREGGMQNKNLFGTHTDPAAGISNTGMISWNQGRRDKLIAEAKKAGVWDESKGQLKETAEALRFQARFLDTEMRSSYTQVADVVRDSNAKPSDVSKAFRDKFIVYRTDQGYSGGAHPEYGSVKTKEWYDRLNLGQANLEATRSTQQPQGPQPVQKITQNFGYSEGDRVNFEYGGQQYHAYRSKNDWAIFKGTGIGATLLDRSGGKNKAVVDQFMKVVQQQTSAPAPQEVSFNPPPATSGSVAKAEEISRPLDTNGASNIVALMMPQAQQQPQTSSTANPSSSQTSTTGRSFNPLDNSGLYNTNVLA